MGDGEYRETAAARLDLLRKEFTTPARRAEPARHVPSSGPPSTPVNLGILDHMAACRHEVITHTRAAAPDTACTPGKQADIYEWAYQETSHLAAEQQIVRDAMILRQSWEHSLAMDDHDEVHAIVRRESCPSCRCWTLFWRPARHAVVCANQNCSDDDGLPVVLELNQIALAYVTARNARSSAAT
jgi:hypothetical protein